jgi:hypothetical protein
MTDAGEETTDAPERYQWNQEPRLKGRLHREDSRWKNLGKDLQTGDREANSRIFCPVTKHKGLDIVEGSHPSKTEEKLTSNVGIRETGDVGAPVALDRFATAARGREK